MPTRPEPRDGAYTEWTAWTDCSKACAGGERTRNRTCTAPSAFAGGRNCAGGKDEADDCNTDPCPGTGGFSEWSAWSACDVNCGEGKMTKTRYCDAADEGCTGETAEYQACVDADGTEECAKRAADRAEEEAAEAELARLEGLVPGEGTGEGTDPSQAQDEKLVRSALGLEEL